MGDTNLRKRARQYFYLLTIGFIIVMLVVLTDRDAFSPEESAGLFLFLLPYFVFILLTIKGYGWAKWILTVLLSLLSFLLLWAGLDMDFVKFKIAGIYCLFFAVIPHLSRRLKPISVQDIAQPTLIPRIVSAEPIVIKEQVHDFPFIVVRYKALLIDGLLSLVLAVVCVYINRLSLFDSTWIIVLFMAYLFLYEPLLTAYASTLGQKLMNIGVRDVDQPEKRISLSQAYIRFFVKGLLGWISFISIVFSKKRRALHDLASSSVMINL